MRIALAHLLAMVRRFIPCLVALASGLLVSCYPYPEDPAPRLAPRATPAPTAHTAPLNHPAPPPDLTPNGGPTLTPTPARLQPASPALPQHPSASPAASEKLVESPSSDVPVAHKAPGKEGYVLSPYNNKLILVRGIPSGTVVPDPASPSSARKYFRVP